MIKLFYLLVLWAGVGPLVPEWGTMDQPRRFELTFQKAIILANNRVGHDWEHSIYFEDKVLEVGESLVLSLPKKEALRLVLQSIETDRQQSDIGERTIEISYQELLQNELNTFRREIIVIEAGGANDGNVARIQFRFSVRQR